MKSCEIIQPKCYSGFSCKGGICRSSCCSGWSIRLSKNETKKMKKKLLAGDKIKLVDESARNDIIYAEMILNENGDCPFLNEEKMCSLQKKYGERILFDICTQYPRNYFRYFNDWNMSLSLGCERVLEILLEEKDGLSIERTEKKLPEKLGLEQWINERNIKQFPDSIHYYYEIKNICICILQAREISIEKRIIILGIAIKHIDDLVNEKRTKEIPEYVENYMNALENAEIDDEFLNNENEPISVILYNLMMLNKYMKRKYSDKYKDIVSRIKKKLNVTINLEETIDMSNKTLDSSLNIQYSQIEYEKCKQSYHEFIKGKEYFIENIMVNYLLYANIPFHRMKNSLWENYTYFIWVYSIIKFVLTVCMDGSSTDEEMIDCCANLFRMLSHNNLIFEDILEDLKAGGNNTLSHMALFLQV